MTDNLDKNTNFDLMPKIILIGDQSVGKTSILSKFQKGTIPKTITPTIGV